MCKEKTKEWKRARIMRIKNWKVRTKYEIPVYKSIIKLIVVIGITSQGFCCANIQWRKVLLEKLTGLHLVKIFPAFYGNRSSITAFTSAHHLSLSWTSSIQSIAPHFTSWTSVLILSSHLRLGLPIGLFPSGIHTITLSKSLPSRTRATCPACLILLDFITHIIGEKYRSLSSSLCSFLHSPVTSSLLCPHILLNNQYQTSSAHVSPSILATKIHTHLKQLAKL